MVLYLQTGYRDNGRVEKIDKVSVIGIAGLIFPERFSLRIILGAYMRIALVCGTDSNIHSGTDRSKMSRLFYQEAGSA